MTANIRFRNRIDVPITSNIIYRFSEEVPRDVRAMTIRLDHEEAVRRHSVESYLLEEMSAEDEMRFEEHCVDCSACAEALKAALIFISNITPPLVSTATLRFLWKNLTAKIRKTATK